MTTHFKSTRAAFAVAVFLACNAAVPLALAETSDKPVAQRASPAQKKAADKDASKAMNKVLGASSPSAARQAFAAADQNNDGVVSLDEFHKDIVKSWHVLDLDHNGEITLAELQAIPDRASVQAMLRLLKRSDSDGDMKLSFKELVAARMAFFDEADADHDDRLTLAEALAFEAKHHPQPSKTDKPNKAAKSDKSDKAGTASPAGK
ncbi:EF-hand domain-containing protein [Paucibacter sp. AS339]|uniref:EF-hand domain-containing protein n=1 Tax=Paucibacter hankyongi TaxID=3133434 RepID=UPI0030A0E272